MNPIGFFVLMAMFLAMTGVKNDQPVLCVIGLVFAVGISRAMRGEG